MQGYVWKSSKIGASIMQVPLVVPQLVVESFVLDFWLARPERLVY